MEAAEILRTEVQEVGGKAEWNFLRPGRRGDLTAVCDCLTVWGEATELGSSGSATMGQEAQDTARDVILPCQEMPSTGRRWDVDWSLEKPWGLCPWRCSALAWPVLCIL